MLWTQGRSERTAADACCERKELADVLECIRRGTTLQAAGTRLLANCERTAVGSAAARALQRPLGLVDETIAIAEQIRFDLGSPVSFSVQSGVR